MYLKFLRNSIVSLVGKVIMSKFIGINSSNLLREFNADKFTNYPVMLFIVFRNTFNLDSIV